MVLELLSSLYRLSAQSSGSGAVRFLKGETADPRGRTVAHILSFSDNELERCHNYIQWLFPLNEPSVAVPGSPVLSRGDIRAIRKSEKAQANMRAARERMQMFYAGNDHWLCSNDHNHLRITRIIQSLRLLVGDDEANDFRNTILALVASGGNRVNSRSLQFWTEA